MSGTSSGAVVGVDVGDTFTDLVELDRAAAVRQMPALIKAYLRLGGTVGEGAFVDHAFNTVDICLILECDAVSEMQKAFLAKGMGRG